MRVDVKGERRFFHQGLVHAWWKLINQPGYGRWIIPQFDVEKRPLGRGPQCPQNRSSMND